jgi:tRNA(fMet)-specific endonuclease VapC
MKCLIDTNICIHFFKGKFALQNKFEEVGIHNCAISEITFAELIFGAENSKDPQKNLSIVEQFVDQLTILPIFDAIPFYAKEKARLRKTGRMISDFDLLIGSTAVANNLIMVTENVKEFDRIRGIVLENWITRK